MIKPAVTGVAIASMSSFEISYDLNTPLLSRLGAVNIPCMVFINLIGSIWSSTSPRTLGLPKQTMLSV